MPTSQMKQSPDSAVSPFDQILSSSEIKEVRTETKSEDMTALKTSTEFEQKMSTEGDEVKVKEIELNVLCRKNHGFCLDYCSC